MFSIVLIKIPTIRPTLFSISSQTDIYFVKSVSRLRVKLNMMHSHTSIVFIFYTHRPTFILVSFNCDKLRDFSWKVAINYIIMPCLLCRQLSEIMWRQGCQRNDMRWPCQVRPAVTLRAHHYTTAASLSYGSFTPFVPFLLLSAVQSTTFADLHCDCYHNAKWSTFYPRLSLGFLMKVYKV